MAYLTLAACALASGCREQRAWDRDGWHPAESAQRVVIASVLAAESLLGVIEPERIAGINFIAADAGYSLVADRATGLRSLGQQPEALLSVRPDLVIVDAYTRSETLALLSAADVPVVRTCDPHSFADIEANLRLIGRITHLDEPLRGTIRRLRADVARVRAAGDGLGSWRLMSLDGALHSYGQGSLFDVIADAAGARNVVAENGVGAFRKLDIEEILAWRPDALVVSVPRDHDGSMPQWILQRPGLEHLTCVQQGRVIFVPGPLLSTTSHHLVDAAAFVQRQLRAWGRP